MKHAILVNDKRLHAYADSDEYVAGVIPELIFPFDNHPVIEVIKHLQEHHRKEEEQRLALIGWNLLPWLDRFGGGVPRTLERRLAEDPEFFSQVIGFVYRSRTEHNEAPCELDERQAHLASAGFRLLYDWTHAPGLGEDGRVNEEDLLGWLGPEVIQRQGLFN